MAARPVMAGHPESRLQGARALLRGLPRHRKANMKPGMILVLVGVALIVCALMDVFKMSQGINLDLGFTSFSKWPPERWGLLGAGVGVAILGAWTLRAKR